MKRINSLVQKLASIEPKAAPLAISSVRSTHMGQRGGFVFLPLLIWLVIAFFVAKEMVQ
jgi:hypothetical protein